MTAGTRIILIVGAAVAMQATAGAQVPQGNPIADLIAKGKRSLNDFAYRAADSTWQQLLQQPLSRQQRIDVLQLLVATLYPDDEIFQRQDSAVAVIRQLAGMGVTRMVVRDVSWPGLDDLYRSTVAVTPVARGAGDQFDTVSDVLALVADGYQADEIPARVTVDCYTFSFDELETSLQRTRGQAGLPAALKRTCSRVQVESDPPGATATVASRDMGVVPEGGLLRWVRPDKDVEVAVALGTHRAATTVEFPQGKVVQARFFLPRDTVLWPAVKTAEQIAEELRIFDRFSPSTPRPQQPVRPRRMNAMATGFLWGLLGGAAGYAVGQFVPAVGCTVNETVPQGETWKVRGERYTAGETVNMGAGSGCIMTIAGGSFGGMFLFSSILKTTGNRSANARYNDEVRQYPTVLREWEQRERRAFAERNTEVRQAQADQQARLTQTQAQNATIRARNANLPRPQISVRDLSPADTAGAAATPPSANGARSGMPDGVAAAGAPNPEPVAFAIGSRDRRAQPPQ